MHDVLTALALEHGDYRAHGYKVERYGTAGWMLTYDGAQLMIANYGGLAPTKAAAMLEAYTRIDSDARALRAIGEDTDR